MHDNYDKEKKNDLIAKIYYQLIKFKTKLILYVLFKTKSNGFLIN
ncbi:hypothetical protein LNTAR_09039 [Lentisphaera araneosa HTCC2155]|uniref:Uncharacterized protein n=1 Tax=Lentisphaera araneosa HTCC2155 TaxID=313628 RepID=A6DI49_9BACT|nr:hypothetical protein LNTAR_09039 [Lentisphaera araneosa HTCC2155]